MPDVKPSGGRTFSKTCLVRGREGEGRKAILLSKREQTRIAPIGPDGLTTDGSEKVPTSDILDPQPAVAAGPLAAASIPGVMGDRGSITIPSEIRRRLRLQAGSPVLIEVRGDSILIHPAEIRPRAAGPDPSLDALLARVTPGNIHEEVPIGDPTGREAW